MSADSRQSAPAKCAKCSRPMAFPLVCDYCHAMNPDAAGLDHFAMLGVERRFDLDEDELHSRFIALSRHVHPDFHAGQSDEADGLVLQVSAGLNDAYRTLKDPASRAAYLLETLGGPSASQDKSVPDGFLGTMMMLQEESADADQAGDSAELGRLRDVLRTQLDGMFKRVGGLFDQYDQGMACEAVRADVLAELRKWINAVSYIRKLLSQLP